MNYPEDWKKIAWKIICCWDFSFELGMNENWENGLVIRCLLCKVGNCKFIWMEGRRRWSDDQRSLDCIDMDRIGRMTLRLGN